MKNFQPLMLAATLSVITMTKSAVGADAPPPVASKPLFRDPIFDGAADPVVIWNRAEKKWFMLYTNRRANVPGLKGVSWVHGTKIGIAESIDGGLSWKYRGVTNIPLGTSDDSHWAPDVIYHKGVYHMFLSFVPGMHEDWSGTRAIHHLTSPDLINWSDVGQIKLASNRVIDAGVMQMPDGTWRLWYNDEKDHKSIDLAESPDLFTWTDKGKVIGDKAAEGPKVFRWRGKYWMIVDQWKGLGVYRSDDAVKWEAQPQNILVTPGTGADDGVKGGHADVVVSGDRAYLFYFTHPDRTQPRRSSIQVTELEMKDGWLECDRDKPVAIKLLPPVAEQIPPAPVLPGVNADPHLAVFGDTFYLYPTTDGTEGWLSTSFRAWSSKNLKDWTDEGVILDLPRDLTWAKARAWAPAIAQKNGKFFYYYSADTNIGVAVADKPTGPFVDALGKPLVPKGAYRGQMIDPMVFVDDDGAAYLYFGQGRCNVVKLNDDMISFDATQIKQIAPPGYNEGSFVFKRQGVYYLSWSEFDTRDPRYSVAYGTSSSPLGPFIKAANNPILQGKGLVKGAGHHSIAQMPGRDEWVIAYHRFKIPGGDGYNRETCLSPLRFDAQGAIIPVDVFEPVKATSITKTSPQIAAPKSR